MSATPHAAKDVSERSAGAAVGALVARARVAQRIAESYDQARVDELVTAAGWAIVNPDHNRALAETAVRDSGLGNIEDKIAKNRRKTIGLLADPPGITRVMLDGDAQAGLMYLPSICALPAHCMPALPTPTG